MTKPIIETPRGKVFLTETGFAKLEFNTSFKARFQEQYLAAQRYLDSEVLRKCEPYTPFLTGMLIKSGTLGTEPGSGLVQWITPYARYQYYLPRKPGTQTGPLRGPKWFHRMWEVYRVPISKTVKALAGGG